MKCGTKIYHVCLGDDEHFYFGSITAIYGMFSSKQLGISKERLWAFGVTPEHPFKNHVCAIFCGEIHRVKTARKNPLKNK